MVDIKVVKNRDQYPITVTASQALDGATVRLLHRVQYSTAAGTALAVTDASPTGTEVTHLLDGTLLPGQIYEIELEATWAGTPPTIITFPTDQNGNPQVVLLQVVPDIA